MAQQQRKKQSKFSKQMEVILNDPTNTFIILNPQILVPQTKESERVMKELLHATNIIGFKQASQKWVSHLTADRAIKEMLIKIKQISTNTEQVKKKYSIQLHPIYRRFYFNQLLTNNSYGFSTNFLNLTKEPFKEFLTNFQWDYRQNYFSIQGSFIFSSPFSFSLQKGWGKPLDRNWVTDQRKFAFYYFLPSDSRRTGKIAQNKAVISQLYWEMKGYDSRLGRLAQQKPGTYLNMQSLKSIDIIQAGYSKFALLNNGESAITYRVGLGTDYYHTWYLKMIGTAHRYFRLNSRTNLLVSGSAGLIEGKNVIPHQCFSRNQNKWMGERSLIYGNCRFDLVRRGIPMLQALRLIPSKYASFWVSKSFQRKIKLEGELGISFSLPGNQLKLDISLLRLSGVKGQPKFGLKYQF